MLPPMKGAKGIAVVGIGCRFPGGANNPAQLWSLLRGSVDAVGEIPADRWNLDAFYHPDPSRAGKTYCRWGGFVEKIDEFDAQFFGISPREAGRADPQQRLLLEVAYEALEDAGIPPEKIAGTNAGVFVGISAGEYGGMQTSSRERSHIDAYTNIGAALSIAANRISYFFDLHGPSLSVDTACSSSLVAIHEASQRIWSGECELAFVGGVNVLIRPESTIGFSKASMLARDGRCKSFDAKADGYSRAEGCGVVILKSLTRAIADGDAIYAVIRATAVNQDGRTPGISVPNGKAQEAILRQALAEAGMRPNQVQYVEAHGTGTPVGDPIEATAIGNVLGGGRTGKSAVLIGSIKTNIGHLEAGSGVAGLIKVALSLQHREIPANLHFDKPNPKIPFEALGLRVAAKLQPWPDTGRGPAGACINSFGFGGTNAHVVLQSAPEVPARRASAKPATKSAAVHQHLLPLSARSSEALRATARAYVDFLGKNEGRKSAALVDICRGASLGRGHHDFRLALVGASKEGLAEDLQAFLAGETRPAMSSGMKASGHAHKVAFVFSGMGSQWLGMGRELLANEPVFRKTLERCDHEMRKYASWRLLNEWAADAPRSRMHEAEIAQPALFAFQAGIVALLASWGVRPDGVVGHSVGEIAAAYTSGALRFEDAVRVIFHRSRLQQRTTGHGKMLAVGLSVEEIRDVLAQSKGGSNGTEGVAVAAINSPVSVTLSGEGRALERVAGPLAEQGVFCRFLSVEIPYHSAYMDPLEGELRKSLRGLRPRPAAIPLYSTVSGTRLRGPEMNAAYWWHNVRDAVLFAPAIDALAREGHNLFIEIGPHPVLSANLSECLNGSGTGAVWGTGRRGGSEQAMVLSCLGRLYTAGYPIDWQRVYPKRGAIVKLPSYPWQRERYWQESGSARADRLGDRVHPLLGVHNDAAQTTWIADLDQQSLPYLGEHRVEGSAIYPASAYVEMALAAAGETIGAGPCVVEELEFRAPLALPDDQGVTVETVVDGQRGLEVYSQRAGSEAWTRNASGKLRRLTYAPATGERTLEAARARCTREIPVADCYGAFQAVGLHYGPGFRGIARLWAGEGEAVGEIRSPGIARDGYHAHPALLDACFQVLMGARATEAEGAEPQAKSKPRFDNAMYLPVRIERVTYLGALGDTVWSHVHLLQADATRVTANYRLFDANGKLLTEIEGFSCKRVEQRQENLDSYLQASRWVRMPLDEPAAATHPDFIPEPAALAERLRTGVKQLVQQLQLQRLYDAMPSADALARAYIYEAFSKLGWKPEAGDRISVTSFAKRFHVAAHHERFLARLFEVIGEDGALRKVGQEWEVKRWPAACDSDALWRDQWNRLPETMAELMLVRRCARSLAEVLRDEVDPLQLIFPDGSLALAEPAYADSPHYRIYNLLARRAVEIALEAMPAGRMARILEIGGGTGGATVHVLPKLNATRAEYVFTDVAPLLVAAAEDKFREFPFVRYQPFDVTADPAAQGLQTHSFDLILASDVLHATPDLRETIGNVKQLLAPGGLLVLLEGSRTPLWILLVFGMLKGWWAFTDLDVRQTGPWVSQKTWLKLLGEAGFRDPDFVADTDDPAEALHSVILARAPGCADSPSPRAQRSHSEAPGTWLLFADGGGTAARVAERLRKQGEMPLVVEHGDSFMRAGATRWKIRANRAEDMERLMAEIGEEARFRGIVHLWSLDAPPTERTSGSSLAAAQWLGCLSGLHLARALAERHGGDTPRLFFVTRGAQAAGDGAQEFSVAQSPLWGLARTVMNEYPRFRTKSVDLGGNDREIDALHEELWADDEEAEVALRGDARYVNRVERVSLEDIGTPEKASAPSRTPAAQPFRAEVRQPGLLESAAFVPHVRRPVAADEIEIEVCAASLNFKDIMLAMGLLPREPVSGDLTGETLGFECAGRVCAVGAAVTNFAPGDEVIACGPGTMASHFIAKARNVLRKPRNMTMEEASSVLVAYLTAYYSLHELAHLEKGERILIHAAAGGVGLAAIRLAQNVGAEIFATAGSATKRDLLHALGVPHVMDSRSLAFAGEIMERTKGAGVDVVLNSLGGEAIPRSLGLLTPGGRFVEIGKRDIFENNKLALGPFGRSLSFFAVDLDKLRASRPDFSRSLFEALGREFESGALGSLPFRTFPAERLPAALRYMAQAKHIGKVVVSLEKADVPLARPLQAMPPLSSNATYLVTGGFGGFGLVTLRWMVDRGARHLAVISRSGATTEAARAAVEAIRAEGVEVADLRADISDERQLAGLWRGIAETMPPVRGVLHAAMVMDDATILQMTDKRMQAVMAPKMLGAWHLHTLTKHLELDFFVLFSSLASLLGGPGQSNYVAANAFLDALAADRHAAGLPALSISWGAVGDAGYVFENPEILQKLVHAGVKPVPTSTLLLAMEELLRRRAVHATVGIVDWPRMSTRCHAVTLPRFSRLVGAAAQEDGEANEAGLGDRILAAPPEERQALLQNYVRDELAKVLGASSAKLDFNQPMINLGLDSLMAVALVNRIRTELGVEISPMKFMEGISIAGMSACVVEEMRTTKSA
jgi:acyl transferase domain-containing protein/NADPH:quinone reductase-like Zn-dependent oxidoreductase/SAM-dependent methyltransferase/acyl carrier protein